MYFRAFLQHLIGMKHFILAAVGTFVLGIYLGYTDPDSFAFVLEGQRERLQELVGEVKDLENPQWKLFSLIFFNNIGVSLMMVYMGIFFGIMPLFALLTNGLLLGYLAGIHVPQAGWGHLLLSILPHGIIEIPAIILACAYGIKFGTLSAKLIVFFFAEKRRAQYSAEMLQMLKLSLPLAVTLAVLMLSAALVESMITYVLVRG